MEPGRRLDSRLRLYLVADPEQCRGNLLDAIEAALGAGVTAVQLRAKRLTDRASLALAREVRARCAKRGVLFLLNDRIDLALASGADGVHLGVDDLPLDVVRRIAGPDFVLGYSPETDGQAERAAAAGADYLGLGPVFSTASKADAGEALGLPAFRRRIEASSLPAVGIGGIDAANCQSVVRAGAVGVAVVGAILRSTDPAAAANRLSTLVSAALANDA